MENPKQEKRYRQALDKLSKDFLHHPDVSLIDIGFNNESGSLTDKIVLRIHVRKRGSPPESRQFPKQVDGVPVIIMYADYQPDTSSDRG